MSLGSDGSGALWAIWQPRRPFRPWSILCVWYWTVMAASTTIVSTSLEIEGADPGGTSSNTLVVGSKTVVYGELGIFV